MLEGQKYVILFTYIITSLNSNPPRIDLIGSLGQVCNFINVIRKILIFCFYPENVCYWSNIFKSLVLMCENVTEFLFEMV